MTQTEERRERYVQMTYVKETATGKGLNQILTMEETGPNFKVTEGRVDIKIGTGKPRSYFLPISQWETFLSTKINCGWIITKKQRGRDLKKAAFSEIEDESVRQIVSALIMYTKQMMSENYTARVEDISDEMIALGTQILKDLSTGYERMSVAEYNIKLKTLFSAIPRRIKMLSDLLAKDKTELLKILEREQETFELMTAAVKSARLGVIEGKTILSANQLEWRDVTDEEYSWIRKLMKGNANRLNKAWRVKNLVTQKRFDDFCAKEGLSEKDGGISHLFHGSKHEAWWSIVTNGLVIDPERFGAAITGKAYGYGTYFAPDAIKSFGYTSIRGSKWANGSSECGYMGIYRVATGSEEKRFSGCCNSSLSWNNLQKEKPGALCTWAKARHSGFIMDEVIVYQDCQDTIEYLLEVR